MIYTISNEYLTVKIDTKGAELQSIQNSEGCEYLWQGNPEFWKGKAPNLFPYIGRLTEGKYRLNGKEYKLERHGFVRGKEFKVREHTETKVVFTITDDEETKTSYPFVFDFSIIYELEGKKINISYEVKNKDDKDMYFGVGGHPAFQVPMEEGLKFEDYYLEFLGDFEPKRVGISEDCLLSGNDVPFELKEKNKLPLTHDLFDDDAIVLKDMWKEVLIASDKGEKKVRVSFPQMDYLGLWHMPKLEAPYVCIEPWSSLFSRQGIVEDLEKQESLIMLEKQKTYVNAWWISIE